MLRRFQEEWPAVSVRRHHDTQDYVCDATTHHWSEGLIWKVARFKNHILEEALRREVARAYLTIANFFSGSGGQQVFSNGVDTGDATEAAAYGGLHQSVTTLLDIMESFINGDMLRSNYPYAPYDVLNNGFGIDDINVDFPRWGTYYDKNGLAPRTAVSWQYVGDTGMQGPVATTGIQTIIYFMPEDIRLVVVANSWATDQPDVRGLVHDALEANLHESV